MPKGSLLSCLHALYPWDKSVRPEIASVFAFAETSVKVSLLQSKLPGCPVT